MGYKRYAYIVSVRKPDRGYKIRLEEIGWEGVD
jgi:hypothetical protein